MPHNTKVAKYRNYWLAMVACLSCSIVTLMTNLSWESANILFMADANVCIWLFVAWMFDDHRPD